MNVSLTPELETFIQKKVASGMYSSASELVREALRLIDERDAFREKRMEAMDAFIQEGLDDADQGKFVDPDEFSVELDQIIADAERELNQ